MPPPARGCLRSEGLVPGGKAGVAGGTLPCHTQEDGTWAVRTRKGCDRTGQDKTGCDRTGPHGPGGAATHKKKRVARMSHPLEKRQLPTLPTGVSVPSAWTGLTSLFGMGRGGFPAL